MELPEAQGVNAMSNIFGHILAAILVVLATSTTYLLWTMASWRVAVQIVAILMVGAIGEHYISGQGYYHYTKSKTNGFFVGRVPLWIPFMWVFAVQGTLLFSLMIGLPAAEAILSSGLLGAALDLVIIEPALSRERALWTWTPVDNGYFGFLPSQVDRFTAPPGNYLVWLLFPAIANWLLYGLIILFP